MYNLLAGMSSCFGKSIYSSVCLSEVLIYNKVKTNQQTNTRVLVKYCMYIKQSYKFVQRYKATQNDIRKFYKKRDVKR